MIIVCSIKTKLTYERHKSRIRFQKLTGGRCVFEDILLMLQKYQVASAACRFIFEKNSQIYRE